MTKNGKNKGGRPLKFKSVEELQIKIDEYFKSCWRQKLDMWGNPIFIKDDKGKKTKERVMEQFKAYTVTGLAVFLDTSRETLIDYQGKKKYSDTIKRAKERCQSYSEEFLYTGKNPAGAIFNLKTNFGYQDKQELDVTSKGQKVVAFNYIVPQGADDAINSDNSADN